MEQAFGNNSPLIKWKEEKWGWEEEGQDREEENNVCGPSNVKHAERHGLLYMCSFYTESANNT
jgi:hypothetical protein